MDTTPAPRPRRRVWRALKKLTMVAAALLVIAAVISAINNQRLPTRSQSVERLDAQQQLLLAETLKLKRELGNAVWPGWGDAPIPVLLYNEQYGFLTSPPDVPGGGEVLAGDAVLQQPYYRITGQKHEAFAVRVGAQWAGSMNTKEWMRISLTNKVRRQLPTLLEGGFVERAENLLAFGLPGRGKTHFLCALGRELILRRGCTVYFTPTFKLVQQLLTAKKELRLDGLLKKLDRFEAIILDDLGYVQQSREEMEVLFTFLAERYERRSVLVSSNLVFSKWDQIFKDPMTTMAAVDRLVHHAIILEFNGESMRVAQEKEKGGS